MSKWTAERIRERLGTSTIVFPATERLGREQIKRVKDAGIGRIEVGAFNGVAHYDHHDEAQVEEIAQASRELGVKVTSVHCPPLAYDAEYPDIMREVLRESVAAARAAERMGADIFVCHFHNQPPAEITCREMLKQLEGCRVRIATENGIILTPYVEFVDRFNTDRLGIVIDIGHTRRPLEGWLNPFTKPGRAKPIVELVGKRLIHMHIHDYHNNEDHRPPFEGEIEWGDLFDALDGIGYAGALMFESLPVISAEDTLGKVGAFPEEFIRRWG